MRGGTGGNTVARARMPAMRRPAAVAAEGGGRVVADDNGARSRSVADGATQWLTAVTCGRQSVADCRGKASRGMRSVRRHWAVADGFGMRSRLVVDDGGGEGQRWCAAGQTRWAVADGSAAPSLWVANDGGGSGRGQRAGRWLGLRRGTAGSGGDGQRRGDDLAEAVALGGEAGREKLEAGSAKGGRRWRGKASAWSREAGGGDGTARSLLGDGRRPPRVGGR